MDNTERKVLSLVDENFSNEEIVQETRLPIFYVEAIRKLYSSNFNRTLAIGFDKTMEKPSV